MSAAPTIAVSIAPEYRAFLEAKVDVAQADGVGRDAPDAVHPVCKPHQRDVVRWMVEGGRRAVFAKFGLGKGIMQQEAVRLTLAHAAAVAAPGDPAPCGLIVAPLAAGREFRRDAREKLGRDLRFVRTTAEVLASGASGTYLTNYESVRDGKLDVSGFTVVSLDEASVLRGFGGTKTFREFMRKFDRTPYRFVATATPAPNEYLELLAYAAFLGVMDVGEAKTRFFKRDSEKADALTLHAHQEDAFWSWVHTWAVFLQAPSDLGYSDDGYDLPGLEVHWHQVDAPELDPGTEKDGQGKLLRDVALGVTPAAREKRASLPARVAAAAAMVAARPDEHVILWHDLEDERRALEAAVPGLVSVYGSQPEEAQEAAVSGFADGAVARLAGKPMMLGSGTNLQRHCAWAVFVGVNHKFNDIVQAIHRLHRFQQPRRVRVDLLHTEAEVGVVRDLKAKWARHDAMTARMQEVVRAHGLNTLPLAQRLRRTIGVERLEAAGEGWRAVRNDCVEETRAMPEGSVAHVLTSIPFGTQYEYSPSYHDFGHSADDQHFWAQMNFLSPELFRVLMPGRVMAVHVKDRVRPGGMDGLGFQTVSPFHADAIHHYRRHGFAYVGMITVSTDVVRENNQTYRLGWTEQCKDGSRMSVGMPEYVLLFRKPPTDRGDGYADVRVVKEKAQYTRGRWQIDAHALWRSSGDRLLDADELSALPADEVYRRFRAHSAATVYDYAAHVAVSEALDARRRLPPGFQLLPVQSSNDDVWTDVARMRTLNGAQQAKGREAHLCPLQFDIVDRLIERFTNPGELVYDPFGGLMTVPLQALKRGRRGLGVELNAGYWADGVAYLRAEAERLATPTLFDALDALDLREAA